MECASTLAASAIEQLISLHALVCMGRASDNKEYFKDAVKWVPRIEGILKSISHDLNEQINK